MQCCHCQGLDRFYSEKAARRELKSYREKGPTKSTRRLLESLSSDCDGRSLLDIGGGIGAIQHELMAHGASGVTNVDASTAYLKVVQEEAERRGYEDRAKYLHGDFVDLAAELEDADIVTLDRVLCCYPDMKRLVELSSARARNLYCLVYPRPTWYMKFFPPIVNAYFRLRKNPFRVFLHRTEDVNAVVEQSGLNHRSTELSGVWQIVLYSRTATAQ